MSSPSSAVIYARISKDPDQTLAGVERQIQQARDYISSQPGLSLNVQLDGSPIDRRNPGLGNWPPGVFCDNDISAAKGSRRKRPEYDRMMRYARGGDIQVIVTAELDRLWRDLGQFATGITELEGLDIKLQFLEGGGPPLDLTDPMTKALVSVMAVFAAWYASNVAQKQRKATKEAAEVGAWHGARPFGYQLKHYNVQPAIGQERTDFSVHDPVKVDQGDRVKCPGCSGRASNKVRTLVIDDDATRAEAAAVLEMFRMAATLPDVVKPGGDDDDHMSVYKMLQYFDGEEITDAEGRRISRPAILTASGKTWQQVGEAALTHPGTGILRAQRYLGVRQWSAKWDGGKRPPGTLIKGNWPALPGLDDALFDAVQVKLSTRRMVRAGSNTPAHLATGGYVFGGLCGHTLGVHVVRGKRRYRCVTRSKSEGKCVNFDADVVDREIKLKMFSYLAANASLTKQLEHAGNTELQELCRQRDNLIRLRDELEDKLGDGLISDQTYRRQHDRKEAEIAGKEAEITAAQLTTPRKHGGGGGGIPTGKAFRAWWADASLDERRVMVRKVIEKVLVYPAGSGNKPDPKLIRFYPLDWAKGTPDAETPEPPDPVEFTSKGKIAKFLRDTPDGWFTREDIAAAAGLPIDGVHKNVAMLREDVSREWRRRGGQRACFMYRWGGGTWQAAGGDSDEGSGARGMVKAFLESDANSRGWFTQAEIAELSGAGVGGPHIARILGELLGAGFIQKRRAPNPRKHTRWQYSVNGR